MEIIGPSNPKTWIRSTLEIYPIAGFSSRNLPKSASQANKSDESLDGGPLVFSGEQPHDRTPLDTEFHGLNRPIGI